MSDLYILGAGCSRNYSQLTHQIQGLLSPLNNDFFKMARLVIEKTGMKSDSIFMEEIDYLIKSIAPLYGSVTDLFLFDNPSLNLEDVITLLDTDFKLFSSPILITYAQNESRQLRTLKELLVRTLDYALMGPPCKKHHTLAKRMNKGDVILSFNYDLLIDTALLDLGKLTHSGYKMNFFKVKKGDEWVNPCEETSEVTLLKLHGSLNWAKCSLCGSLLFLDYRKKALYGYEPFNCPRCSSDDRLSKRMIIPPLQSKDYSDKDITYLWIQADNILKDFSKIICIGYSFSPLDYAMTSLMRRYKTKQNKTPEVILVTSHGREKPRLKQLFNVQEKDIQHYRDLGTYLKETK